MIKEKTWGYKGKNVVNEVFYKIPISGIKILDGKETYSLEDDEVQVALSVNIEPFVKKMMNNYILFVDEKDKKEFQKYETFFVEILSQIGAKYVYCSRHYKYIDVVDILREIQGLIEKPSPNKNQKFTKKVLCLKLLESVLTMNIVMDIEEEQRWSKGVFKAWSKK